MNMESIISLDQEYVAGTYGRFPVELVSGKGSILTDINGKEGELYSRLWHCVMENGIIRFPKPQDCIFTRYVRSCTTSEKRYELV